MKLYIIINCPNSMVIYKTMYSSMSPAVAKYTSDLKYTSTSSCIPRVPLLGWIVSIYGEIDKVITVFVMCIYRNQSQTPWLIANLEPTIGMDCPTGDYCNIEYPWETHLKLKSHEILFIYNIYSRYQIDGLVKERGNSSVLAKELHLSCTNS